MTTIVNSPTPAQTPDSGGNGFLFGTILIISFIAILLYFGIPAISKMTPIQINIPAPQVTITPTVIPDAATVTPTK